MSIFLALGYFFIFLLYLNNEATRMRLEESFIPTWILIIFYLAMLLGAIVNIRIRKSKDGEGNGKPVELSLNFKTGKGYYLNLGAILAPFLFALVMFINYVPLIPTLITFLALTFLALTILNHRDYMGVRISYFYIILASLGVAFVLTPANPFLVAIVSLMAGIVISEILLKINAKYYRVLVGSRGVFHVVFIAGLLVLVLV